MSITAQLIEDFRVINRSEREVAEKGPNCLLVEDDPNDLELSKYALKELGVRFSVADTGDKAIALLDASKDPKHPDYDIVFLDLVLRGSAAQGIQVLEHIRRNFPSVHIILVSGHIDDGIMRLIAKHKGEGAYLGIVTKPLQKDDAKEIFKKHRFNTKEEHYEI